MGSPTVVRYSRAVPEKVGTENATTAPGHGSAATPAMVGKQTLVSQLDTGTPHVAGSPASASGSSGEVAPPTGGINQPGFIDNSMGSYLHTGPAETGAKRVVDAPVPPATRVFVSGTHPSAPEWWYVTAFLPDATLRGYVQYHRVNIDLPEPLAKLHQVVEGDTPERLAKREFSKAVRDGHDLRYYENVLLYVNQQRGRDGIRGTYQDPNILGRGDDNIKLIKGHRIWLVSPDYAKSLEGVVPDGSFTNGAVAKAKRFVQHVTDIIETVTRSPDYLGEVAGDYAQALRDHMPEIIGIVAGFIAAEAASAFLAATPTGVGQIAAVLIQLALSAFGAVGMVEAGVEALKHGSQWLTLAWTAHGKPDQLGSASREFLRMLVSIAMAALAYTGAKANLGKAVRIANAMPPVGLVPALATANGAPMGGAGTAAGVQLGVPGPLGPFGTAAAMTIHSDGEGGGSKKPEAKPAEGEPAKLDPSMATARPAEQATAGRVASRAEFRGRTFKAPPPPDPGFDWIDDLGRTFDAMGDGAKSKYFKLEQFKASIDHHLTKGNTFTVIDMTGYTADQIASVRAYVDTLPASKIIRVGF